MKKKSSHWHLQCWQFLRPFLLLPSLILSRIKHQEMLKLMLFLDLITV